MAGARRNAPAAAPLPSTMFFFFNNRLGCLGSLLVSAVVTLLLLVLMGWIRVPGGW